ncbi:cytochrome P450 [Cyathus striatus]|nr:cytochrome P450 [Cyathus striatus]
MSFNFGLPSILLYPVSIAFLYLLARLYTRKTGDLPYLRGPTSPSYLFGALKHLLESPDAGAIYQKWSDDYGSIFKMPTGMGTTQIVICDSKAISHILERDTTVYVRPRGFLTMLEGLIGKVGLIGSDGENHRRQRQALSPAYGTAVIKNTMNTFFELTVKLMSSWDSLIEEAPNQQALIDVQDWMNRLSLDTMGISGFSHEFSSLEGTKSAVSETMNMFNETKTTGLSLVAYLIQTYIPIFARIPTRWNKLTWDFNNASRSIVESVLMKFKKDSKEGQEQWKSRKTAISVMMESASSKGRVSEEEIVIQLKGLLLAGYDPTAMSITWTLIELCRHVRFQDKLREELAHVPGQPSWDQLQTSLPYLDAVVHEVLRLHPPLAEMTRSVSQDDLVPLSRGIIQANGRTMDQVLLPGGTLIMIPIHTYNSTESIWGSDAWEFNPGRWITASGSEKSEDIALLKRHVLTFGSGPRVCLGKTFAIIQLKAVLSSIIKAYTFELPNGPQTQIGQHVSFLPRPKIASEDGAKVPLLVRRVT